MKIYQYTEEEAAQWEALPDKDKIEDLRKTIGVLVQMMESDAAYLEYREKHG